MHGIHRKALYFGIPLAITLFSIALITTFPNNIERQAMAQTLKYTTNNSLNLSSAGIHNLIASPLVTNSPNVSKATPTQNISSFVLTNVTGTTPQNHRPTVSNITWPINLTKPVQVELKANDPDINDTFTFYKVHLPMHGKLGIIQGNIVTYTPDSLLSDNFTYRAKDAAGLNSKNNGTVTLDHPPIVFNRMNPIKLNGTNPVKFQLNGSDPDKGDKLTFSMTQMPLNALFSNLTGNSAMYTPKPGFNGLDKFAYRARDSEGLFSNNGTVFLNVGKPLPTPRLNVTGPTPPFTYAPILFTVLVYAVIVAGFMFLPLVYDMFKAYNRKDKPSGEGASFPDLARSLMAFGIIIILGILGFHVLVTVTYNVLPSTTNTALVDIIKNLTTILGGAVSAIVGFYFGQKSVEKASTSVRPARRGPTVVSSFPNDKSNPVPVNTAVTATFSEPVTIESNSLTLKDLKNSPFQGTSSLSPDGKTLTFNKSHDLVPNTTYTVTITGVKDLAGNNMSSDKIWTFTTAA